MVGSPRTLDFEGLQLCFFRQSKFQLASLQWGRADSSGTDRSSRDAGQPLGPRHSLQGAGRGREGFGETGSTAWSSAASAETLGVSPLGWGLHSPGPWLAGQASRRSACRELPTSGCAVGAPHSSFLEECRVTHWPANCGMYWARKTKKPHAHVSSVGNVKTVRLGVSCRLGFSGCHEARQAKLQAQVSKPAELSLILMG